MVVIGMAGLAALPGSVGQSASAAETPTLAAFPTGTPCWFEDSWHAPRGTDAAGNPLYHEGVDVIAVAGTPIYAVTDGKITRMSSSNKGGIQLYLAMPDGTYFFHAHLQQYAAGLTVGSQVKAGQVIAYVGQTGDAKYSVAHLHFEVHPGGGAPIDPFPVVKAVDACGGKATPSSGGAAATPAKTPTGSGNPAPTSPVVTGPVPIKGFNGFSPTTPIRVADSRDSYGLTHMSAGTTNYLTIAGRYGIPADAKAVAANFTVTNPDAAGFLTAWPCDTAPPETSVVNFIPGQTVANFAMVGLGGGRLCMRSNVSTDLIVDLTGWQGPSSPYGFSAKSPVRLVDTREIGGRVGADGVLAIKVGDAGAKAATLNVTAVGPSGSGFLTVYPCGVARPTASNLNYDSGAVVPNSTTVGVGANGTVCVFSHAATDIVVDLTGVWQNGKGSLPAPVTPVRLLDTRSGVETMSAGATIHVPIAGRPGVPASVKGAQVNLTVTGPAASGYLTAWACGEPRPMASNVNYAAGQTVANSATVGLGNGELCVYSSKATQLVVDITGYLK